MKLTIVVFALALTGCMTTGYAMGPEPTTQPHSLATIITPVSAGTAMLEIKLPYEIVGHMLIVTATDRLLRRTAQFNLINRHGLEPEFFKELFKGHGSVLGDVSPGCFHGRKVVLILQGLQEFGIFNRYKCGHPLAVLGDVDPLRQQRRTVD